MVRLRTALLVTILGGALLSPPVTADAEATLASLSAESSVVSWTTWLPSVVTEFDPASTDDCIAGRDKCATKTIPAAWRMAFEAAETKQVNGNGDLLLGISAHINRDLPFVMAASGLVSPDGTSRKPDFDKVNELLNRISPALNAELAARFDPSIRNEDGGLTDPATFQLILGWRERAWRNAEALVSAPTKAQRELVAQRIELTAETEAALLLASSTYQPPLTGTEARDSHCATHYEDPPPEPYPFTPR